MTIRSITGENVARPSGLFGWVCFDWAIIPCFGLINIFIFAPYFTKHVIGDPVKGQAIWGYTQASAGLLIALISPFLGAIADAIGPRKPWIGAFGVLAAIAMSALWNAQPGVTQDLLPTLIAVVVLSVSIEYMVVFHNAMLPSIVEARTLGRWSGASFAIGYLGTVVALFAVKQLFSLDVETISTFGLTLESKERTVGPLMAVWMAVFIFPLFLLTPDRPSQNIGYWAATRTGVAQLLITVRQTSHYKNVWLYFLARMIFYDGLLAVFVFSGVFAAGLFGWKTPQLAVLGIVQFMFAALGGALGGVVDDRIGSRNTLFISVFGVACATAGLLSITPSLSISSLEMIRLPLFDSTAERAYLILAAINGVFTGPALASSRTMVARLAPLPLMTQFFGLYSLLGRATAFLAPLMIGALTAYSGSQRVGFSVVLAFMLAGLCVLLFVREKRSDVYQHGGSEI